jgi:twitching motility protein PilT
MSGINSKQEMEGLLATTAEEGASDLHIAVGRYPTLRIDGRLVPLDDKKMLSPKEAEDLIMSILDEKRKKQFLEEQELDISYELEGKTRFRVNLFFQKGNMAHFFQNQDFGRARSAKLGL